MNTLIIYASKHGCAEKCSGMLAKNLTGKVDTCNLNEGRVPELTMYDKVIIGGSIYTGRIQKEVNEFCQKNLGLLRNKKVGLFICCINKNAADTQLEASFPEGLVSSASIKESFGGEIRFSKLNFFEKGITKMVSKALAKEDPSFPALDTKKDMSMLSEDKINKFAQVMNAV